MVGDEIIRAQDGDRIWNTFSELRNGGLWGQGVLGTPLTVWVLRDGAETKISLTRGIVNGFEYNYQMVETGTRQFLAEYPDLKTRLVSAIESDGIVAYQVENQGQNVRYGRSAVWAEFGFVHFQEGKIVDWRSSEESLSEFKQLGFTISAPQMVKA